MPGKRTYVFSQIFILCFSPTGKSKGRELKVYFSVKNNDIGWVLVAHACNLSYLGGRDQEDCCSELYTENSLQELSQKYPIQNWTSRVA
jgi:hypothetical protein